MGQERGYISTDPNFGAPVDTRYVSTDPNFGEPVSVRTRTWSDRLGLNEPSDSALGGFFRGAGAGAVDLAQGVAANITGQLNSKLDAENAMRQEAGLAQTATLPDVQSPGNFSAKVGEALPVVGEMAIGGAPAARQIVNAIPRAARAGQNFEKVMGAAKDIVVDVEPTGKHALRILDLSNSGAQLPKVVRDFLNRVTSPTKTPMTYKQSRDFASNLSSLSANEKMAIKPVVRREIAQMAAELNLANANAAKAVGKGAEYKAAMREYAQAMRLRDALDATIKHSKKAALGAAGLGGAYYLLKD